MNNCSFGVKEQFLTDWLKLFPEPMLGILFMSYDFIALKDF
jgi:hypothetical protein